MSNNNWKWNEIGVCGVDAGLLMIADPCYWVKGETEDGEDAWSALLDNQREDSDNYKLKHQIPYDLGHAGKGVMAGTAHGDGSYPVYALTCSDAGDSAKAMIVVTDELDDSEIDALCNMLREQNKPQEL